jgi:hypothetical protein
VTKTTLSSQSITYDWLLNTLMRSWMYAQERVSFWRKNRAFAIEQREEEKQRDGRKSYDKSEYDGWSERIRLNDQHEVHTELVSKLIDAVQSNPYPGQRKRVLTVAADLIPEGGKVGWRLIFEGPDFNFPRNFANEKIIFPVLVSISVADIERKLWELVREDDTIAAVEIPAALNMDPNSKAYRTVKSKLEARDWVWKIRRIEGKSERVVLPPRTEQCQL